MMSPVPATGTRTMALFIVGAFGFVIAGMLLVYHIREVRSVQEVALPLVLQLPSLEHRTALLKAQMDVAELHSIANAGSQEERVHVYVLPEGTDVTRTMTTFDAVRTEMRAAGTITDFSAITLQKRNPLPVDTGIPLSSQMLSFSVTGNEQGIRQVLTLVNLMGVLTVGDAMRPEEVQLLLSKTEAENPVAVVALEQFLSTDLLSYARDPKAYEDRLLKSFSSESFATEFKSTIQGSLLRDAEQLLGTPLGMRLEREKLWPTQAATLENAKMEAINGAMQKLAVTLQMYSREKK